MSAFELQMLSLTVVKIHKFMFPGIPNRVAILYYVHRDFDFFAST